MSNLIGKKVLVTGGSRGLGLGIVEALVAREANVTVVARDAERLRQVSSRLGVGTLQGDVTDEAFAQKALREVQPSILVLNAGAQPNLGLLHEQTWASFGNTWDSDVKAGFHWLQAALRLPLPRGSRVLVGSSGAAVNGSPLSGAYAGSKRMLWLLAQYANVSAKELGLEIRFQAILPQRIIGETDLGRAAAEGYARRKGVSVEAFLAGFGPPMPPAKVGEHVAAILTDPKYESALALGLKGDGITVLEA